MGRSGRGANMNKSPFSKGGFRGICMLEYSSNLKEPSRELRRKLTEAENALWSRLRKKQIQGVQFYRQKPIGRYIVDFYAPAAKLVVEVDGSQHFEPEHMKRDAERDLCLAEEGLLVMRFDNLQVLRETDAVVETIARTIQERLEIPPDPLLSKGEKV
jgi:very-short-patch-repair endonuclease